MEQESDGQATRRQVVPNVTLDQQCVLNENLLCHREITLCMSQSPLVEDLLSKAQEFNKTMEAFKTKNDRKLLSSNNLYSTKILLRFEQIEQTLSFSFSQITWF